MDVGSWRIGTDVTDPGSKGWGPDYDTDRKAGFSIVEMRQSLIFIC